MTTLVLLATAVANLFSKQIATKYGVAFTIVFFLLFTISEKVNSHRHKRHPKPASKEGPWKSSIWISSRKSMRAVCMRGRAACWWPCATRPTWST